MLGFISCKRDKVVYEPTPYALKIPSHFPDMIIPEDNPMTVEGVELGRKLFYEELLSGDNTMSCASCHAPANAFTDTNRYSTGIDGIQGNRNSMALINLGWATSFFWDGRAATLEEQILGPVPNPIEMHQSWPDAVAKLQNSMEYRNMFFKAFGDSGIDSIRVSKAIAQFLRTMISGSSKYDVLYKFANGIPMSNAEIAIYASITPDEKQGYLLFNDSQKADCFHCHNGTMMRIDGFSNNGIDSAFSDIGRAAVTGNPSDIGKFKVPTLRNIALTAPYMHDGRFATLDEVIDHYSTGVHVTPTLDPLMQFSFQGGVNLDPVEKDQLKKFLLLLTDEQFVNNPDFQEP